MHLRPRQLLNKQYRQRVRLLPLQEIFIHNFDNKLEARLLRQTWRPFAFYHNARLEEANGNIQQPSQRATFFPPIKGRRKVRPYSIPCFHCLNKPSPVKRKLLLPSKEESFGQRNASGPSYNQDKFPTCPRRLYVVKLRLPRERQSRDNQFFTYHQPIYQDQRQYFPFRIQFHLRPVSFINANAYLRHFMSAMVPCVCVV